MKKSFWFLCMGLCVLLIPSTAFAASPWTEQTTYADKVKGKLDYGFKNALGGWTEVLTEPYDHCKGDQNILVGIKKGIWNAVADTAGGVLHLATFPLTQVDVPLPDGGVSLS